MFLRVCLGQAPHTIPKSEEIEDELGSKGKMRFNSGGTIGNIFHGLLSFYPELRERVMKTSLLCTLHTPA